MLLLYKLILLCYVLGVQDLSRVCCGLKPVSLSAISKSTETDVYLDSICSKGSADTSLSNGRLMLIDGTSIIYRSYYKLLGMSGSEFHQTSGFRELFV